MRESQYARRQRRRRVARRDDDVAAAPSPKPRAPSALSQWQWTTFPVFAAFALGMVVMGLFASTGLALAVFFAGVFGVALSVAHIVRRQVLLRRRRR